MGYTKEQISQVIKGDIIEVRNNNVLIAVDVENNERFEVADKGGANFIYSVDINKKCITVYLRKNGLSKLRGFF